MEIENGNDGLEEKLKQNRASLFTVEEKKERLPRELAGKDAVMSCNCHSFNSYVVNNCFWGRRVRKLKAILFPGIIRICSSGLYC